MADVEANNSVTIDRNHCATDTTDPDELSEHESPEEGTTCENGRNSLLNPEETHENEDGDAAAFEAFDAFGTDDDEDDFGDFRSNSTFDSAPKFTSASVSASTSVDNDHSTFTVPAPPAPIREIGLEEYRQLIQTVFDHNGSSETEITPDVDPPLTMSSYTNKTIDVELSENSPHVISWAHIQNFEDSHCLLFKWNNSNVHQRLLKCLNITKASVIMYSGKWGVVEVPKFATSLLDTPLQPEPISQGQSQPVVTTLASPNSKSSGSSTMDSEFNNFQSHHEPHHHNKPQSESNASHSACDKSSTSSAATANVYS